MPKRTVAQTKRTLLLAASALVIAATSAPASAQPPSTERAVAAFEEARALIDGGHCDQALPKLKESLGLHASIGAHLSFADCTDKASPLEAWQHLKEAARLAYLNHDDRLGVAEARAADLAKRLPSVRFEFAPDDLELPGLEVRLDGVRVEPYYYRDGVVATTEGNHLIEVTAANRAWSQRVTTTNGGTTTLRVAMKEIASSPGVAPPAPAPVTIVRELPEAGSTQRTLGYALAGVGIGGLALGSIFGAITLSKRGDMQTACGGDLSRCTGSPQSIEETRGSAHTSATVATVGLIGGALALAAGATLIITSPKRTAGGVGTLGLAPSVGVHGAGVTLVQRW